MFFQELLLCQNFRALQKGVAVHDAVPHKFGVLQAGDHAEHPFLFAPFQVGLEADEVIERAGRVLGAQLDGGPGPVAGARVAQTDGAQGAEPDRIRAAGGHDLNRHTALVDGQVAVKVVERCALGGNERRVERLVFLFIERAVQVVRLAAAIAGRGKNLVIVKALGGHDGRDSVIKAQPMVAGQRGDGLCQCALGQRAAGDEHGCALVQRRDLLAPDRDVGVVFHHFGHGGGKHIAVHGQRTARRHAGGLGGVQQMAAHHLHLNFQKARRGVGALGLERVGANQLREARAFMGRGKFCGLLLVQLDLHTAVRQPKRRLAAGQTGTDDFHLHSFSVTSLFSAGCRGGYAHPPASRQPVRGSMQASTPTEVPKAVISSQSPSQTRTPLWRSTAGPSF